MTGPMDNRQAQLAAWTAAQLDLPTATMALQPVSGDASFRRYFRAQAPAGSVIAVDAPPQHEDNPRFIKVAQLMREAGVQVPEILAADIEQGFLLLSDLGDDLYLPALLKAQEAEDDGLPDRLYGQAITALVQLQSGVDKESLDPYDQKQLRNEMHLFDEWFCRRLLEIELDDNDMAIIEATYQFLEQQALAQETVAVHRDYHSRNLMILPAGDDDKNAPGPGVIDFQDAVAGAYTYDLVSLFRDCYIRWPLPRIQQWLQQYLAAAQAAGIARSVDAGTLQRDFDLMGMQRHLKVLGIFSRLSIRDNKKGYLADIPLVIGYLLGVAADYPEMREFVSWFSQRVMPVVQTKLRTLIAEQAK